MCDYYINRPFDDNTLRNLKNALNNLHHGKATDIDPILIPSLENMYQCFKSLGNKFYVPTLQECFKDDIKLDLFFSGYMLGER